jgi:chemotaxis protein MotB
MKIIYSMKLTQIIIFSCILLSLGSMLSSCVTARRYDAMAAKATAAEDAKVAAEEKMALMEEDRKKLDARLRELTDETSKLKADSARMGELYRRNKTLLDDLFDKYDRLDKTYNQLLSNSASEAGSLSKNLSEKEKQLLALEQNLLANKAQVDKLSTDLQSREQRVKELEQILKDKDKAANDLKNRVSNALLSFKDSDLTVDIRNGKVYVSLSEKLLFKSGSYAVDPKGAEALKKVANVLKTQPDISVMVEGHTDDVPIAKGNGCVDDNWDLSALRATSIVNILSAEGVTPNKLIAAGRGEFMPIAVGKTPEIRQKNRRTEIILTPKLDELFQILEAN